jgi:hypothetical protein
MTTLIKNPIRESRRSQWLAFVSLPLRIDGALRSETQARFVTVRFV